MSRLEHRITQADWAAWLMAIVLALTAIPCRGDETPKAVLPLDEECRKLIVGTWRDYYQGTRTMTLRADGTGTMLVELSGVKAALYTSKMRFDMKWSLDNGRLKKQSTSGSPAGKVKFILKLMGDRVDEPILELTRNRLLLLDGNGKRKYDWKRLELAGANSGQ